MRSFSAQCRISHFTIMLFIGTFFTVFLIQCAFSEDSIPPPCNSTDIFCIRNAANFFLAKTSESIPEFGIMGLDPLHVIFHIEINLDSGENVNLRNVTLTGLRNSLVLNQFKISKDPKTVDMDMEADLFVNANIEFEDKNRKSPPTLAAVLVAKGKVMSTAKFNYYMSADSKGEDHFVVGPETLTSCKMGADAEVSAVNKTNPLTKADEKRVEDVKEKILCDVFAVSLNTMMHNLRSATKYYPKTSFLTDF